MSGESTKTPAQWDGAEGLAAKLFDEQGTLSNEATREFLTKFMQSFAQWVERHV